MNEFSTVDGFVEISECMAEMIKYIANEPSVGLFYIQQHTQKAVPNVVTLKNNVLERSREVTLHTEDLEDSIAMVKSMKECGSPIAEEMIQDVKNSLAMMSVKQPRRGPIHNSTSSFQMGRTRSWGPATWSGSSDYAQAGENSSYFSTVFKSARERASGFKWPQLDSKEPKEEQKQKLLLPNPSPPLSVASASISSVPDTEADELPLSSEVADEIPEKEEEDTQVDVDSPSHKLLLVSEKYDHFKANKEAKLEEWLGGTDDKQP